jgi:uncharacterized protein (TIGR02444 family)
MSEGSRAFWDFSLRVYQAPGVEPACLEVQDAHGLDVNLVLFCCWAGSLGIALADQEMDDIVRRTRKWQGKVVQPLRAIRRDMKPMVQGDDHGQSLRNVVKKAELSAEKLQQHELARAIGRKRPGVPGRRVMQRKLLTYARAVASGCDIAHLCEPIIAASL